MTGRIFIEFSEIPPEFGRDERPQVLLQVREPDVPVNQHRFTCAADDPVFAAMRAAGSEDEVVRIAGQRLFAALAEAPVLQPKLVAALEIQPPERRPIYLDVSSLTLGQELPWEALFAPALGDFLGLDSRWPVGRVTSGARPAPGPWRLDGPLRIAAVLSCLGVPAEEEWQALRTAVEAAGLDVSVLVLVSENELFKTIEDADLPWVREVRKVPGDLADLQRVLTGFGPHVLHLFCHGSAADAPYLAIAVGSDWDTGTPDHSHFLEAAGVGNLLPSTADVPWLIVLNACASAAPPEGTPPDTGPQSLATALVRGYAVPAVIGMREPVLSTDAACFAEMLYRSLFDTLREAVGQGAGTVTIDWASLAVDARDRLRQRRGGLLPTMAAKRFPQWTLPVVTVRPKPFDLEIAPASPAPAPKTANQARLEANLLQTLLARLTDDTPPSTVQALREELHKALAIAAGRG